jgi:hypothetical protein
VGYQLRSLSRHPGSSAAEGGEFVTVAIASEVVLLFAWYAGVTLVLALAEHRWPAGARSDFRHRLFNFCIAAANAIQYRDSTN